jgi:hypothetical protein
MGRKLTGKVIGLCLPGLIAELGRGVKRKGDELPASAGAPDVWPNRVAPPDPKPPAQQRALFLHIKPQVPISCALRRRLAHQVGETPLSPSKLTCRRQRSR